LEEEPKQDSSDLFPKVSKETKQEDEPEVAPEANSQVAAPSSEAEPSSTIPVVTPESEDFIAQCDQIIQELGAGTEGLMEQNVPTPDPVLLSREEEVREEGSKGEKEEGERAFEEEDDDLDSFMEGTPAVETVPSLFGVREDTSIASQHPVKTQSVPFTGDNLKLLCDLKVLVYIGTEKEGR
jgi:hypothetical protein